MWDGITRDDLYTSGKSVLAQRLLVLGAAGLKCECIPIGSLGRPLIYAPYHPWLQAGPLLVRADGRCLGAGVARYVFHQN